MAKSYLDQMMDILPTFRLEDESTMQNLSAMWKNADGTYARTPLAEIKKKTGDQFADTLRQLLGDGNVRQEKNEDYRSARVFYPGESGALQSSSEEVYKSEYCADLNQKPKKPGRIKQFFNKVFGWFKNDIQSYERHQRRIEALKPVYAPEEKAPEEKAPEVKAPEVKAPEVKAPAQEKAPEEKGLMAIADKEARFQEYQRTMTGGSAKLWKQLDYAMEQVEKFRDNKTYKREEAPLAGQDPDGNWDTLEVWKKERTTAQENYIKQQRNYTAEQKKNAPPMDKTKLDYAHDGLKSVLESLESPRYDANVLRNVNHASDHEKAHSFLRLTNPTVLEKVGMLQERLEKLPAGRGTIPPHEYLELVGLDVPKDKLCDNYERFCHAQYNVKYGNNPESFQKDVELIRGICQNAVEQANQVVAETGRETNSCHLGLERPFVESHEGRTLSYYDMVAANTGEAAKIFMKTQVAAKLMSTLVESGGQLDEKSTALYERAENLKQYAHRSYHTLSPYGVMGSDTSTNDGKGSVQSYSAEAKKALSGSRWSAMAPDSIKKSKNIPGAQARLAHTSVTAKEPKLSQKDHDKMVEDLLKDTKFLNASNTSKKIEKMLGNSLFKKVKVEAQKTVSKSTGKGGL